MRVATEDRVHLLSNRGAVLFLIAVRPDITAREIADSMCLTRRSVWSIIGDLRRANMLRVRSQGRRHHYRVNLDAPFRHPTLDGILLRDVLGPLVGNGRRTVPREMVRAG
ncbi:MAG: HTH domain-containing protein [Chloroflexi bacterium]|nr:HTH domain-containing protein [Chloroflexota bacterium]